METKMPQAHLDVTNGTFGTSTQPFLNECKVKK